MSDKLITGSEVKPYEERWQEIVPEHFRTATLPCLGLGDGMWSSDAVQDTWRTAHHHECSWKSDHELQQQMDLINSSVKGGLQSSNCKLTI